VVDAVGPDVTLFKVGDEGFTPARSSARAPIRNFIWSMSVSSAASRNRFRSRRPAALAVTSITAWSCCSTGSACPQGVDPPHLIDPPRSSIADPIARAGSRADGRSTTRPGRNRKNCLDLGAHDRDTINYQPMKSRQKTEAATG